MKSGARNGGKMPCESCAVQFSVFKRKRVCYECERYYCSGCLRRGGGAMCAPCRVLSTRPLARGTIAHLKVRDLQCFLQRQNVSTRGCVEKDELLSLCVSHVNSAAYRRRGSRNGNGTFTLKGFTNNINELINSAFDLRPPGAQPAPPPPQPRTSCCNATHVHIVIPTPQTCSHTEIRQERFTVTPGGERDVRECVEAGSAGGGGAGGGVSRTDSRDSTHVESADCFEIEDIDDAGWEFVTRPADPLPNDSEVLMSATEGGARRDTAAPPPLPPPPPRVRHTLSRGHLNHLDPGLSPGLGQRAASELDLRSAASGESTSADTASLKDEPLMDADHHSALSTPQHVTLETLKDPSELEALSVRQLKELLVRNRVEYRGCLERADLLTRAQMLYKDHAHFKDELDNLPIEECCKICMAAPLECVLLECGHIAACTRCSKQLAECPICRQYVVRAVRFFRS